MLKVISYSRVSTNTQDPERQRKEIKEFCSKNNYEIVDELEENISGLKPWKERGLGKIINKNIDGVVVNELSRFGRDAGDVLDGIKELHNNKIWLHSINQNLKTLDEDLNENMTSKLILTILSGVAEMETSITKQRSISGLINSAEVGNWTGGKYLPLGYSKKNKKLVIEENESKVIKKIFQLYLQGNGTKRIANYLNNKGIPTRYNLLNDDVKQIDKWNNNEKDVYKKGKDYKWADGTIYSILTNKVYIGKKEGKGVLKGISLYSPAIINEEVFWKVQDQLKNKQRKTSIKYTYILEGKPKCGICNKNYFAHKRSDNKDNTYKCLSIRYGNNCGNYGIGIPKLNAGVWKVIRYNKEELRQILSINKREDFQNEIVSIKTKIKLIKDELNSLKKSENKLLDLFLDGNFNKDELYKRKNKISKKIENLEIEIKANKDELKSKKDFINKQREAKKSLSRIKEDVNILKSTLNKIINKIIIFPVKENLLDEGFKSKQDKLVFVEVYTFLKVEPITFIISQRSKDLLIVNDEIVYNKETKILSRLNTGEEEALDIQKLTILNLNKEFGIKQNSKPN